MLDRLISGVSTLYVLVLIGRWVVETFMSQHQNSGWFLMIRDITEPILATIRKLVPSFNGIDFSYLIGIIAVKILAKLLMIIV